MRHLQPRGEFRLNVTQKFDLAHTWAETQKGWEEIARGSLSEIKEKGGVTSVGGLQQKKLKNPRRSNFKLTLKRVPRMMRQVLCTPSLEGSTGLKSTARNSPGPV